MGRHYEKNIFRQLQEVLERCDKLENKLDETKAPTQSCKQRGADGQIYIPVCS